jgi:hypothetical protein
VRSVPLLVAVLVAVLMPGVAQAHGGATVTIHSDGRGSVWTTASWADGHAVTEPVEISMTARSGTATVGPVMLRPTADPRATQTYEGTLATGAWQAVLTIGAPLSGTCQARIQVAAAAATPLPLEVACLIAPSGSVAAPPPSRGGNLWLVAIPVVLLALGLGIFAVLAVGKGRRAQSSRSGAAGTLDADAGRDG